MNKFSTWAYILVSSLFLLILSMWIVNSHKHEVEYLEKTSYLHKNLVGSAITAHRPDVSSPYCHRRFREEQLPDRTLAYYFFEKNIEYGTQAEMVEVCVDEKSHTVYSWQEIKTPLINL